MGNKGLLICQCIDNSHLSKEENRSKNCKCKRAFFCSWKLVKLTSFGFDKLLELKFHNYIYLMSHRLY